MVALLVLATTVVLITIHLVSVWHLESNGAGKQANRLVLVLTTGVMNIEIRQAANSERKTHHATVQSQSKQLVGIDAKWRHADAGPSVYEHY